MMAIEITLSAIKGGWLIVIWSLSTYTKPGADETILSDSNKAHKFNQKHQMYSNWIKYYWQKHVGFISMSWPIPSRICEFWEGLISPSIMRCDALLWLSWTYYPHGKYSLNNKVLSHILPSIRPEVATCPGPESMLINKSWNCNTCLSIHLVAPKSKKNHEYCQS